MAKLIDRLLPYLLVGVVAFAVLYGLGRWDAAISERDRRLDAQTKTALATGQAWRARYEDARRASAIADSQVARLERAGRTALAEGDSIAGVLDTLTARVQINWREAYELRTVEVQRVRMALDSAQVRISILLVDRDRWRTLADSAYTLVIPDLEKALQDEHDARKCTILGLFGCPSRTTAFIVGAGLGLLVSSALK